MGWFLECYGSFERVLFSLVLEGASSTTRFINPNGVTVEWRIQSYENPTLQEWKGEGDFFDDITVQMRILPYRSGKIIQLYLMQCKEKNENPTLQEWKAEMSNLGLDALQPTKNPTLQEWKVVRRAEK